MGVLTNYDGIMTLARRNLLKDKTRMALSVGGVALAVMLILVLNGFLDGMFRQITSYLDHSPAQLSSLKKMWTTCLVQLPCCRPD